LIPRSEERLGNPGFALGSGESSAGGWFVSWGRLSFAVSRSLSYTLRRALERALVSRLARSALDEPLPAYELVSTSKNQGLQTLGTHRHKSSTTLTFRKTSRPSLTWPTGSLAPGQSPAGFSPPQRSYYWWIIHRKACEPSPDLRSTSSGNGLPEEPDRAIAPLRRAV
jgi:hypothetical protein